VLVVCEEAHELDGALIRHVVVLACPQIDADLGGEEWNRRGKREIRVTSIDIEASI
jgi:hypothetical protein